VYRLPVSPFWARLQPNAATALECVADRPASNGAALDNMPLVDTLHQAI
jgi:hypothetical protein